MMWTPSCSVFVASASLLAASGYAWTPDAAARSQQQAPSLSRRQAFAKAGAAAFSAAAGVLTISQQQPAFAAVDEETPRITTRMGGLLEPFQDGSRSIKIMAPYGWNKFEG